MGRLPRLACDVVLCVLATLGAIFLRTDLNVQWPDLAASMPYLGGTAATAALVIGASGLDLGFWRFTSLVDVLKVVGVSVVTSVATVALVFSYNRLEGVARAIPVMQPMLIGVFLLGPRLLSRMRFATRRRVARGITVSSPVARAETVLIVGLNSLAEVYLRALLEVGDTSLSVAGVVSARQRHIGRFLRQYRVLGTLDEVGRVIEELAVHGVYVSRVILAVPFSSLPLPAQEALTRIEAAKGVFLDSLAARLAATPSTAVAAPKMANRREGAKRDDWGVEPRAAASPLKALQAEELHRMARTFYWRCKRAVDLVGAALAAVILLPIGIGALILVTVDLGWPPIFWQNRLGLGGGVFRLYKFRTMAPAHDQRGVPIPEEDRLSPIGAFLRRTRFDELPQLLNVIAGDMSLTGPRPLLSIDQPDDGWDRLVVRPGLTGWAQVQGGREIGGAEKAALDLWWIRNASFTTDLRIFAGTVRMALLGDRVNASALTDALVSATDGRADVASPLRSPAILTTPGRGGV